MEKEHYKSLIKEIRENTNVIVISDWTGEGLLRRPPMFILENPITDFWKNVRSTLTNPVVDYLDMAGILKTRSDLERLDERDVFEIIYSVGNEVWREQTDNESNVGEFKIFYSKEDGAGNVFGSKAVTEVFTSLKIAEDQLEELRKQYNAEYGGLYGNILYKRDGFIHRYQIARIQQ